MGETLTIKKPKTIEFEVYEERQLKDDEVRLRTIYSGISAGTQLTLYRGTNPYLNKKWNPVNRLFEEMTDIPAAYPIPGAWGYEEVGQVIEVGKKVEGIGLDNIVYGTWGHKSTNIVGEEFARDHLLPEGLNAICGIFSQMGPISLNAILDADIHVGETVAVFGQGVPGQIVTQLAKLNGAKVIAVDIDDFRLRYSKKNGADITINSGKSDVAREIKKLIGNQGADVSIEMSGFSSALHQAIRSTSYNGRVVSSGFYQGSANDLYLGEEFHHNRINIICSQINAVSPVLSYRWNRLRMEKTIMELQKCGKLDLEGLITHIIPFKEGIKV